MKKVTKIVTLAAAAMCAFAVVGGSFAVASANQKAYAAVNATYNITYKADSAITVKGPEVAKVGSKVTVELTYNHRLYEVVSVRVGNEYAAANNDNGKSFYFVMPDEDVDVVVNSRYLGAEEDVFDIRNYNGDKGLYLDGCPGNAKAGDIVVFSISMAADTPYRFGNVVELYTDDANQDDVDFVTDGYYYMFEMPAAPVLVFTLVEAKSYFLNFDKPELIDSVTYVDNVSFAGGAEKQCYDNDGDGYFIPYAADVVVEFRNSLTLKSDGVKLGEQEVTFENSKKVKFVMPGKDVDMEVVTSPFYRPAHVDTTGEIDELTGWGAAATLRYDFAFRKSSTSNGDYAECDPAELLYGDYVRVYDTPKAGYEDYKITDLDVYYIGEDGNPYTGNYLNDVTLTEGNDANGHYHQFSVSSNHYGYIVYVYADAKLTYTDDYAFIGSYKHFNLYSYNNNLKRSSSTASQTATLDNFGSLSYKNVTLNPDGDNTPKTGDGTFIVNESTVRAFYGDGFLLTAWTPTNTVAYDLEVFYKTTETLTLRYSYIRTSCTAVEAVIGGNVVGRMFLIHDASNSYKVTNFYATGVTFEFTSGSAVNANGAAFNVKVNGTLLGSVASTGVFTAA